MFCVVISLCLSEDWLFRPKTRPFCRSSFPISPTSEHSQKTKFLLLGKLNSFPNINGKADKKNWLFNQPRPRRESRLKRIYILWNLLSSPCWRSDTKEREWLEAGLPQSYCHICLSSCPGFCWAPAEALLYPSPLAPASHDRDHHCSDPHQHLLSLSHTTNFHLADLRVQILKELTLPYNKHSISTSQEWRRFPFYLFIKRISWNFNLKKNYIKNLFTLWNQCKRNMTFDIMFLITGQRGCVNIFCIFSFCPSDLCAGSIIVDAVNGKI